ncbi:MAG TPA: OmpA family protein, partial [Burkholderiaceae bacterium]|nr:OmpA family protein [Burkholderiaceae bacterium]
APAPAPGAGPAVAGPGAAKVFFETGAVALASDAGAALVKIVEWAKATPDAKVSISGFHDSTGNPEQNAELAKNRAKIVLDVLTAAGVPGDRVMLQKPQQMDGGDGREARRVEVSPAQ